MKKQKVMDRELLDSFVACLRLFKLMVLEPEIGAAVALAIQNYLRRLRI